MILPIFYNILGATANNCFAFISNFYLIYFSIFLLFFHTCLNYYFPMSKPPRKKSKKKLSKPLLGYMA